MGRERASLLMPDKASGRSCRAGCECGCHITHILQELRTLEVGIEGLAQRAFLYLEFGNAAQRSPKGVP